MNGQGQPAPDPHFQSVPYELAAHLYGRFPPVCVRQDSHKGHSGNPSLLSATGLRARRVTRPAGNPLGAVTRYSVENVDRDGYDDL
jgi:hypothetical protein